MRMQRCVGVLSLLAVAGWLPCAVRTRAQAPQALAQRIELLRNQIRDGEQQHAGGVQMGTLWLALANRYQDQVDYAHAEDAFARSLRLLKGTDAQAKFADALDGMGSLYLAMGRMPEAEEFTQKALTVYAALGDQLLVGKTHEDLALVFLTQKRFREAESESAEGLTQFAKLTQPDAGELVTTYLTHSSALCNLRRYSEALAEANHAMQIARESFPVASLEMVGANILRGFAEWKSGSVEQAEKDMREGVRIARSLNTLPQPVEVEIELGAMRWYKTFLTETHRKPEAKAMEAEMAELSARQPGSCGGCTVSAAAMVPGLLLP